MNMRNSKKNKFGNKYKKLIFFLIIILVNQLQAQDFEFIAQHEGQSSAITYFGNYTYFNSGGNINILETGLNNEFSLINRFHCGNSYCGDITINSNRMFLSTSSGVLIYDLNNPENPELIGIASAYITIPRASIISDTLLIVTCEENAILFNISNPYQPEYLSNISYAFNRNNTYALYENILYGFYQGGYSGPQYLMGYDISDPENPFLSVALQLSPDYQGPWPDDMVSKDNYLFVGFNDTLKIYDISASDTIIHLTQFPVANEICNIQLDENTAYIAALDTGIFIYDVSNIFTPELLGIYDQPGFIEKFKVNNDYIFCGLGNKGFRIADKSDLQNIQDVYEYTQTDAAYSVHIRNNLAYFGMKESGLQIVDLTNIFEPLEYGNIETLPGIEVIESIPGYIFCMEQYDSIIHIVTVSDSINPQQVGEIQAEHHWILDFCIDQNRLFILDSLEYIEMYDLSLPESPVLLTTFQEKSTRIAVKDSLMLLCESFIDWPSPSESKLKLFIINDNNIFLHDEIILGDYSKRPSQIDIDHPNIYIRSSEGLIVLNIDSNNYLSICDEISWNGLTEDLAYNDTYIYLTGYFAGTSKVFIIDKTDPYNLSVFQVFERGFKDLASFGNYLCCTAAAAGYYFYGNDVGGFEKIPSKKDEFNISCYPNPCNQSTTIYFTIPKNKKSKLDIYNLSGQKIIDFDITNKNKLILETNSFISGIYLYKISTNERSSIKKLVVTR